MLTKHLVKPSKSCLSFYLENHVLQVVMIYDDAACSAELTFRGKEFDKVWIRFSDDFSKQTVGIDEDTLSPSGGPTFSATGKETCP